MTSHARRRRSIARPDVPRDAVKFCWWWWDRTYVKDTTSSAQMNRRTEALIKNHIEPWLKQLDIGSWHDLHALDVDDLAFKLAGMTSQAADPVPTRLGNADFYTVQEAATLGHCSTSKLKRLSAAGAFPNRKLVLLEGESKERYLIPAADLIANGWDLRHGTPVPDQRTAAAISESSANEVLQLLRRICDDAVRIGVLDRNPAHGVQAKTPLESSSRRINRLNRERILTWTECEKIATRLSVHHQLAMWLGRVLGLRVGEVFGIQADDFFHEDGRTLVTIRYQAGKDADEREADGTITKQRVRPVKTDYSVRPLVVPPSLVTYIETYINAFHRRSDGSIPANTPLIIGIKQADRPSIGIYSARLKAAGRELGIVVDVYESRNATSHTMRRALAGDMRHHGLCTDALLSEILGHAPTSISGGATVTMRHYTPAPSDLAPLIAAFDGIERLITAEIGSLFVPTNVDHHWGRNNPIRDRLDTARQLFAEHWTTPPESTQGDTLNSIDAAEYLGIARSTMVTRCRNGKVPGAYRALSAGQQAWFVPLATLKQLKEQAEDKLSIGEVVEQSGLSYMEIWRRITQDKLSATRGSGNQFLIHRDEVPALKILAQQRAVTETRSVTLATAARSLGIQNRAARELLDSGDLVEDHNPTGNGWIYVTKESVAAVAGNRQRRMRGRPLDISGFIDIQIAVERTGKTRKDLQQMVRAGVLQRVEKNSKTYLHEAELSELIDSDE